VLPFDNASVSLTGGELARRFAAQSLGAFGQETPALSETDERLRAVGVSDGGQLRAYTDAELARAVGADGLLYGTLEDFAVRNVGFLLRRSVRLRLRLVRSDGERLWEAEGSAVRTRVALRRRKAAEIFVEGVAEQALEGLLRSPLAGETRLALERAFRTFPRRDR